VGGGQQQVEPCSSVMDTEEPCMHVAGIETTVTEDELRRVFEYRYASISSVKLACDSWGESRGFAFIRFRSHPEFFDAIRTMQDMPLHGRGLRISVAQNQGNQNKPPRNNGVVNEFSSKVANAVAAVMDRHKQDGQRDNGSSEMRHDLSVLLGTNNEHENSGKFDVWHGSVLEHHHGQDPSAALTYWSSGQHGGFWGEAGQNTHHNWSNSTAVDGGWVWNGSEWVWNTTANNGTAESSGGEWNWNTTENNATSTFVQNDQSSFLASASENPQWMAFLTNACDGHQDRSVEKTEVTTEAASDDVDYLCGGGSGVFFDFVGVSVCLQNRIDVSDVTNQV